MFGCVQLQRAEAKNAELQAQLQQSQPKQRELEQQLQLLQQRLRESEEFSQKVRKENEHLVQMSSRQAEGSEEDLISSANRNLCDFVLKYRLVCLCWASFLLLPLSFHFFPLLFSSA